MISLVLIIKMFTPASASARNIRRATPVCRAMPSPTTDTLATLSSCARPSAFSSSAAAWAALSVARRSSWMTVNETSARPSAPTFCTIMSTEIALAAIFENIARLVPGVSGTPRIVTRASFLASAAPPTGCSADSLVAVIIVPGTSLKLVRT